MIVQKTSVFPAPRDVVFQKLQRPETLQTIAKPYVAFEPVDSAAAVWTAGSTSSYRLRLFGFIPFGTHTIRPGGQQACAGMESRHTARSGR